MKEQNEGHEVLYDVENLSQYEAVVLREEDEPEEEEPATGIEDFLYEEWKERDLKTVWPKEGRIR